MTPAEIDTLASACSAAGDRLAERLAAVRQAWLAAVAEAAPELQALADEHDAARDALHQAVAANPHLFAKPRKRTVDGVTFGFRKHADRPEFANGLQHTVARIRDKLADRAADLIHTRETVPIGSLRKLTRAELRAVKASISAGADEAGVERVRDDLDAQWAATRDEVEKVLRRGSCTATRGAAKTHDFPAAQTP